MNAPTPINPSQAPQYLRAVDRALMPVIRLLIANGVTHPMLDQMLQRGYVAAALRWFVGKDDKPTASRLYMLTGIHRKKIAPLLEPAEDPVALAPSVAQQVLDEWSSNVNFIDSRGRFKRLPMSRREGAEESFEALVESVSKDIRPRAVLDRMLEAGFATLDDKGRVCPAMATDHVHFPPDGDAVVDRVLRPCAESITNTVLRTGERSSSYGLRIEGLSEATAIDLTNQLRKEMFDLLMRFNERAERRAREERRQQGPGPCTLFVGSYEWTDGLSVAAAQAAVASADAAEPGHAAAKAAKATKTAKAASAAKAAVGRGKRQR